MDNYVKPVLISWQMPMSIATANGLEISHRSTGPEK